MLYILYIHTSAGIQLSVCHESLLTNFVLYIYVYILYIYKSINVFIYVYHIYNIYIYNIHIYIIYMCIKRNWLEVTHDTQGAQILQKWIYIYIYNIYIVYIYIYFIYTYINIYIYNIYIYIHTYIYRNSKFQVFTIIGRQ